MELMASHAAPAPAASLGAPAEDSDVDQDDEVIDSKAKLLVVAPARDTEKKTKEKEQRLDSSELNICKIRVLSAVWATRSTPATTRRKRWT